MNINKLIDFPHKGSHRSYITDLQSKFYFFFSEVGALSPWSPAIFVSGLPTILVKISIIISR